MFCPCCGQPVHAANTYRDGYVDAPVATGPGYLSASGIGAAPVTHNAHPILWFMDIASVDGFAVEPDRLIHSNGNVNTER
jgi:hypothetical protein